MSKHTPGPWAMVHEGGADGGYYIGAKDQVVILPRGRMDEADARLIAAAPDLLAALKAMVLNDAHEYRDCHKAARAAIAKAEGTS